MNRESDGGDRCQSVLRTQDRTGSKGSREVFGASYLLRVFARSVVGRGCSNAKTQRYKELGVY